MAQSLFQTPDHVRDMVGSRRAVARPALKTRYDLPQALVFR
jgi:hypothetical protein